MIDQHGTASTTASPGLSIRPYAGAHELATLVGVQNRARAFDGVEYVLTADELANEYANLPSGGDPRRDVLVGEIDGETVAVGQVQWVDRDDVRVYEHIASVVPDARARIGDAMLRAGEARLREIAAAHTTERPRAYATWCVDLETWTREVVLSAGYRPIRWFADMIRPTLDEIPDLELPPGLELRHVTPDTFLQVMNADDEAFEDHWGHHPMTDEDVERMRTQPHLDLGLWRVAWDGEEVAGAVMNFIFPTENEALGLRRGWLDRVSVRRPWRKRGVASALIAASLRALRERGMTSAGLGVDTENPTGAFGLYERLGFGVHQRSAVYTRPLDG